MAAGFTSRVPGCHIQYYTVLFKYMTTSRLQKEKKAFLFCHKERNQPTAGLKSLSFSSEVLYCAMHTESCELA